MLDVRRIRETPQEVKDLLAIKGGQYAIDRIVEVDKDRRRILVDMENLKALRNRVSQEIADLRRQRQEAEPKILEMRQVGEEISRLEQILAEQSSELVELLWAGFQGRPQLRHGLILPSSSFLTIRACLFYFLDKVPMYACILRQLGMK